jgi:hypothetical protein
VSLTSMKVLPRPHFLMLAGDFVHWAGVAPLALSRRRSVLRCGRDPLADKGPAISGKAVEHASLISCTWTNSLAQTRARKTLPLRACGLRTAWGRYAPSVVQDRL